MTTSSSQTSATLSENAAEALQSLFADLTNGRPAVAQFLRTLVLIPIADEEIKRALDKGRNAVWLNRCWELLQPGIFAEEYFAPGLYRDHCRELLSRVTVGDKDLGLGTRAEVIVILSKTSMLAPPAHDYGVLYSRLFEQVFPGRAPLIDGESYPDACAEIEGVYRRRLRTLNSERGELAKVIYAKEKVQASLFEED